MSQTLTMIILYSITRQVATKSLRSGFPDSLLPKLTSTKMIHLIRSTEISQFFISDLQYPDDQISCENFSSPYPWLDSIVLMKKEGFLESRSFKCHQSEGILGITYMNSSIFEDLEANYVEIMNILDIYLDKRKLGTDKPFSGHNRYKRLSIYYSKLVDLNSTYQGCFTCALKTFDKYSSLTDEDFLQVVKDLFNYYRYFFSFSSGSFETICELDEFSVAIVKIMKNSGFKHQIFLCKIYFNPNNLKIIETQPSCTNVLSNIIEKYITWQGYCLKYYGSLSDKQGSSLSSELLESSQKISKFVAEGAHKGYKTVGWIRNVLSNCEDVAITLDININYLHNLNIYCGNTNDIVIDIKIKFEYFTSIAPVLYRALYKIGTQLPCPLCVDSYFEALMVSCLYSAYSDYILLNYYINTGQNLKISSLSSERLYSLYFNFVHVLFSQGLFELKINCEDPDCIKCDSQSSCVSCISGYVLNHLQCTSCLSKCLLCSVTKTCLLCIDGYYYDSVSLICKPCENNCRRCSATECISCYDKTCHTLNGQYCTKHPTCDDCINETKCRSCLDYNSVVSDIGCSCNEGFFLNDSICSPCKKECKSCVDSLTCSTCRFLNSELKSSQCVCKAGYYNTSSTISSNSTCQRCSINCSECSSIDICLKCTLANTIIDQGKCYCQEGYFNSSGSCNPCNFQCKTCFSSATCSSCKSLYAITSDSGCSCKKGYGQDLSLPPPNFCSPCIKECVSCSTYNTCTICIANNTIIENNTCKCKDGFFSLGKLETINSCQLCSKLCKTCIQEFFCKDCIALNTKIIEGECICLEGYYNISALNSSDSCLKCKEECLICEDFDYCLNCTDVKKEALNGTCVCKKGYFSDDLECFDCNSTCLDCLGIDYCLECADIGTFGPLCLNCHSSCQSCSGFSEFECLTCENSSFLEGVCFTTCPVGYNEKDQICIFTDQENPIFKVTFESTGGRFFDIINNFTGITKFLNKETINQDKNTSGIFSSYKRGAYFSGDSYIVFSFEKTTLLSHRFAYLLWILPKKASGYVLNKSENWEFNKIQEFWSFFQVFFTDLRPGCSFKYSNITESFFSTNLIVLKKWNHLKIEFESLSILSISLAVNQKVTIFSFNASRYLDSSNSELLIGGEEGSFNGFMYLFEIYSSFSNFDFLESLVSTDCDGCSLCRDNEDCIPDCEVVEYFDEFASLCDYCPDDCSVGCKNKTSCTLCYDDNCESCSTFKPISCVDCKPGFELKDWLCIKCETNNYFDPSTKKCLICPKLCLKCSNSSYCESCIENSIIIKGLCECNQGYSYNEKCIRNTFNASSWISNENIFNLIFSEALSHNLKESDITLTVDDTEFDFSLKKLDSKNYFITLKTTDYSDGSILKVILSDKITSESNSLLSSTTFKANLQVTQGQKAEQELEAKVKASKELASTGTIAGLSMALGFGLMNFDPSSLFDFLNTAEMFYSVFLFNLPLSPILSEFLLGLRIQKSMPNLLSLIIPVPNDKGLSQKAVKFGYKSRLCVINIGIQLTTLALLVSVWFIVWLLSKMNKIRNYLKIVYEQFTYGFFLRFWVQTFFEVMAAASLNLKFHVTNENYEVFDVITCLTLVGIELFLVFFMVFVVLKSENLESPQRVEEFKEKFSTFFNEFKEGRSSSLFYVFFMMKRIIIIFGLEFIDDGVLQLSLIIGLSAIVPLYVIYVRCFKLLSQNIYHFFNEMIMLSFYSTLFVSILMKESSNSENFVNVCIYLVTCSWAMNIGYSIYFTATKLHTKVKNCRKNKKNVVSTEAQNEVGYVSTEKPKGFARY